MFCFLLQLKPREPHGSAHPVRASTEKQGKANKASHPDHLPQPRTFQNKCLPPEGVAKSSPSIASRDSDYPAEHLPGLDTITSLDTKLLRGRAQNLVCLLKGSRRWPEGGWDRAVPALLSPQCPGRGEALQPAAVSQQCCPGNQSRGSHLLGAVLWD